MEIEEEQPPRYWSENSSNPGLSILYRNGYSVYVGQLKKRSSQTTGFPDGPTFNKIQRVVIEDPYKCVASIKDGEFVLRDTCKEPYRGRLENVKDVKVVPLNKMKLIGGYEVKSQRPFTRISFICYLIMETEEKFPAVSLMFELTPEVQVDATEEKVTLSTAKPYLYSILCPHNSYPITWRPR